MYIYNKSTKVIFITNNPGAFVLKGFVEKITERDDFLHKNKF